MPVGTSDGEFFEDEFDHSVQTYFSGSVASGVPRTDAFTPPATQVAPGDNNAPVTSTGGPGGHLKGNLGDILSMQVDDIPDGVSARDFIRQLQQKTDSQYRKPVITKDQRSEIMPDEDPSGLLGGEQLAMNSLQRPLGAGRKGRGNAGGESDALDVKKSMEKSLQRAFDSGDDESIVRVVREAKKKYGVDWSEHLPPGRFLRGG